MIHTNEPKQRFNIVAAKSLLEKCRKQAYAKRQSLNEWIVNILYDKTEEK